MIKIVDFKNFDDFSSACKKMKIKMTKCFSENLCSFFESSSTKAIKNKSYIFTTFSSSTNELFRVNCLKKENNKKKEIDLLEKSGIGVIDGLWTVEELERLIEV